MARRSQVASGASASRPNISHADMMPMQDAQGAKPGEGDVAPPQVDAVIARVRHSTPARADLAAPITHLFFRNRRPRPLIYDLRTPIRRPGMPVSSSPEIASARLRPLATRARPRHDCRLRGAPCVSLNLDNTPLAGEIGIAETHQTLGSSGSQAACVQVDGGFAPDGTVVIGRCWAATISASQPTASRGRRAHERKCHLNTFPVGRRHPGPVLRKRFTGQPDTSCNYFRLLARKSARSWPRSATARQREVGQTPCSTIHPMVAHWKARGSTSQNCFRAPKELPGQRSINAPQNLTWKPCWTRS